MGFARNAIAAVAALAFTVGLNAQLYTPTSYQVTLHKIEMSTNGTAWTTVLESTAGTLVDIADPATFANAFGAETTIGAGNYKWIRMDVSTTLTWSHPAAPISLSDQNVVVNGPPGPSAGVMTVYWTTHDQGGKPNGGGGDGTQTNPFLLGAAANIAAGVDTTLRVVFAVTDTLTPNGPNYDLAPPEMFWVSDDGSAASLTGTFNTVLYNSTKKVDNNTIDTWKYMSGHGLLTFDGAGAWTWAGTENNFDLKNGQAGALNTSASVAGKYGVNADGSFWMLANGEPGTLRGAVSSDNTMVVATMFDSPTSHLMVFGVQRAVTAAASTMNTGYYFTTYSSRWESGPSEFVYENSFGIVTGNGAGGVTGNSDTNEVRIANPLTTPTVTGPTANLANSFSDTLTINANGTMANASGKLGGGILQSGDAACIAFDFDGTYSPTNEFGFIVRQSAANTFTNASLSGTYFGGHFGDVIRQGVSSYFSGFFSIVFDGAGGASVTTVENEEGTLTVNTFAVTYVVDAATGTVTFSDGQNQDSSLKGAIGPNAMSFILTSTPNPNNVANDQRFLGLGLKQ